MNLLSIEYWQESLPGLGIDTIKKNWQVDGVTAVQKISWKYSTEHGNRIRGDGWEICYSYIGEEEDVLFTLYQLLGNF